MTNLRNLFAPALAALAVGALLSTPAHAELAVGRWRLPLSRREGREALYLDLKKALKKGRWSSISIPRLLPKAALEAHAFAEATDDFAKAGAMVIGMSADDLPTLEKFSTMECRDKFPVAIADAAIIKNYDVLLTRPDLNATITKRTSYVIGKDGKIKLSFTDMDYKDHVSKTLATVQGLAAKR
jgi:peroxiredoxin